MILDEILETRAKDLEAEKKRTPLEAVKAAASSTGPPRDFLSAVTAGRPIRVIAEVKKASPSKGVIRADFDPASLAIDYEKGGAAAISVLTEEKYFQGSLEYLKTVKDCTTIPVLRKDFIMDEYQVFEARGAGADSVLLIAAALDDGRLRGFIGLSRSLGMEPLVEVHDEAELERALRAQAGIIGVNNRDLKTFKVDIGTTLRLAPLVPDGVTLVAESGISAASEIITLKRAGVDAFLIGEALSREKDAGARLRGLIADSMRAA